MDKDKDDANGDAQLGQLLDLQVDPDGVEVIRGPESIVRTLAGCDEPLNESGGFVACALCYGGADAGDHEPTCPWRMAQEWVAANPSEQAG